MNKRHNSYLLTGFLVLALATSAFGQYDYQIPEGYSMAPPPETEYYYEAEPSTSADSSWVEEDSVSTGYQTYTVKKGDTLGSISKKFLVQPRNGKKSPRPTVSAMPRRSKLARNCRFRAPVMKRVRA